MFTEASILAPVAQPKLKAGLDMAKSILQLDGEDYEQRLRPAKGFEYSKVVHEAEKFSNTTHDVVALTNKAGLQVRTHISLQGTRLTVEAVHHVREGISVATGAIVLDRTINPRNTQPALALDDFGNAAVVIGTPLFDIPVRDPEQASLIAADALYNSVQAIDQTIKSNQL